MAELYLTDLWSDSSLFERFSRHDQSIDIQQQNTSHNTSFEEQADTKAHELIDQAVLHDPQNPDAFLIRANILMSQQRSQEALEAITHSHNLWKDLGASPIDHSLVFHCLVDPDLISTHTQSITINHTRVLQSPMTFRSSP